jgi:hypothetical protein
MAQGLRPALRPLRGARITEFENPSPGRYVLRYEVSGDRQSVQYTVAGDGSVKFNFVSRRGTTTETYSPRPSGGNSGRRNTNPPPRQDRRPVGDQMANQGSRPRRGGSRSAMGGFLKGHAHEIDRDQDGVLTRTEAVGNAERMFAKMDRNGDGKIVPKEMEASRRK